MPFYLYLDFWKRCSSIEASKPVCSERFFVVLQSSQYKNYECEESFFFFSPLFPFFSFLFRVVLRLFGVKKNLSFSVVPVKMAKSSGTTFNLAIDIHYNLISKVIIIMRL